MPVTNTCEDGRVVTEGGLTVKGLSQEGYREILSVAVVPTKEEATWSAVFMLPQKTPQKDVEHNWTGALSQRSETTNAGGAHLPEPGQLKAVDFGPSNGTIPGVDYWPTLPTDGDA